MQGGLAEEDRSHRLLSDGQKAHFETFGLLKIRQAFSPEEIGAIT